MSSNYKLFLYNFIAEARNSAEKSTYSTYVKRKPRSPRFLVNIYNVAVYLFWQIETRSEVTKLDIESFIVHLIIT